MSDDKQNWYSNKELFEMFTTLKDEIKDLSAELSETRSQIRKYNGLRETQKDLENRIDELEKKKAQNKGKSETLDSIHKWVPWLLTIFAILYAAAHSGVL